MYARFVPLAHIQITEMSIRFSYVLTTFENQGSHLTTLTAGLNVFLTTQIKISAFSIVEKIFKLFSRLSPKPNPNKDGGRK